MGSEYGDKMHTENMVGLPFNSSIGLGELVRRVVELEKSKKYVRIENGIEKINKELEDIYSELNRREERYKDR